MEYHQITLNEYMELKQKIADKLNNMANDYITVGYYLKKIRDTEAYRQGGYESLAAFALAEYGLSESTTSRFMAINTKFSIDGNTPLLLEDFKNFGSAKLAEMLNMSDEDVKLVKESTTVAQIREIKRFNKAAVEEPVEHIEEKAEENAQAQVDTQPESDLHKIIIEFFRENRKLLDETWGEVSTEEELCELINPSGSRTYKKGLLMIIFYDYQQGLAIKKFGRPQNEIYTWNDFLAAMVDIYKDFYQDGESVADKFYGKVENVQAQVNTQPETVQKVVENDTVEVVPGVMVEVTEKAQEVAKQEALQAQIQANSSYTYEEPAEELLEKEEKTPSAAVEEIATSQVNTQAEQIQEEQILDPITSVEHIPADIVDVTDPQPITISKLGTRIRVTRDNQVIESTEIWVDCSKIISKEMYTAINRGYKVDVIFRKE